MAVSITSALYKTDGKTKEIRLADIELDTYRTRYKGNLYCSTPSCDAKLDYVNSISKTSYFKTHPFENHSNNCIYRFDRVAGRIGIDTQNIINVLLPQNQIARALKESYKHSQMTQEQLEDIRKKRKLRRKNNPKTVSRQARTAINVITNPDEDHKDADIKASSRHRILKRNAETLSERDVFKYRIVSGIVENVEFKNDNATIELCAHNNPVNIKFEEAFFANSPNYQGLFYLVQELIDEYENVTFDGLGEIRVGENQDLEVVIYKGEDFIINGLSLLAISANYAGGGLM